MTPDQTINRSYESNSHASKNYRKKRSRRNKISPQLTNDKKVDTYQTQQEESFIYSRDENVMEKKIVSINLKDLLRNVANADDPVVQLAAVKQCNKLISDNKNNVIDKIISVGFLPIFIQNLSRSDNPTLLFETVCILDGIACCPEDSDHANKLVDAGAVPDLIQLIESPHENVCLKAISALGNIIGHKPALRDFVIKQGIVKPLLSLIKPNKSTSILMDVVWAINMCNGASFSDEVVQEILSSFNELILHCEIYIVKQILWVIIYLTEGNNNHIQRVIESGIVPKLIPLLSYKEDYVQNLALEAIREIVKGTDEQCQYVLNYYALSHFPDLLCSQDKEVCELALWTISDILGKNEQQVQAAIDADLIPKIVGNLSKDRFQIQKKAVWAVTNLCISGNKDQVSVLIDCGVISPLCELLTCKDTETIKFVLDGLCNMLKKAGDNVMNVAHMIEECGGIDEIEELEIHDNVQICTLACWVLIRCDLGIVVQTMPEITKEICAITKDKIHTALVKQQKLLIKSSSILKEFVMKIVDDDNPAILLEVLKLCKKLLSQDKPPPIAEITATGILPVLVICLSRTDNSTVQLQSASILLEVASGNSAQIVKVIDAGAVPALVQLLESPHEDICEMVLLVLAKIVHNGPILRDYECEQSIVEPFEVHISTLRAIANVITSSDEQTQTLLNNGLLSLFPALLSHQNMSICEIAMTALSNIMAGSEQQVQAVIDAGLIPKIVETLAEGELQIQKNAVQAITNLSNSGTEEQVAILIDNGVISSFCNLLDCEDIQIISVVLKGLHNILIKAGRNADKVTDILQECGGIEKIEELQIHDDLDLCDLAYNILEQYCGKNYVNTIVEYENTEPNIPQEDTKPESPSKKYVRIYIEKQKAKEIYKDIKETQNKSNQDDCIIFCERVFNKLSQYDNETKNHVQHLINSIFHDADMDKYNSHLINPLSDSNAPPSVPYSNSLPPDDTIAKSSPESMPFPNPTIPIISSQSIPVPSLTISTSSSQSIPSPDIMIPISTSQTISSSGHTNPISMSQSEPSSNYTIPISQAQTVPTSDNTIPIFISQTVPSLSLTIPISSSQTIPSPGLTMPISSSQRILSPDLTIQMSTSETVPSQGLTSPISSPQIVPSPGHTIPLSTSQTVPSLVHTIPKSSFQTVPSQGHTIPMSSFQTVPSLGHTIPMSSFQTVPSPGHTIPISSFETVPSPGYTIPISSFQTVPSLGHTIPTSSFQTVPSPGHTIPISTSQTEPSPCYVSPTFSSQSIPSPSLTIPISSSQSIPVLRFTIPITFSLSIPSLNCIVPTSLFQSMPIPSHTVPIVSSH